MTADRVLQLLAILGNAGIDCRIDGGWGVDALLGEQTRPHDDLDLVVALNDFSAIEEVLVPEGFVVIEDHRPVRFVMRNRYDAQDVLALCDRFAVRVPKSYRGFAGARCPTPRCS